MLKHAVVEIAGRQYSIHPGAPFKVAYLGEKNEYTCDKVLLISDGEKTEVGTPYLKEKLVFDILENIRDKKIRVATYKPKANTRRVKGARQKNSLISLKK